jgi:hypothetical protein
MFVSDPGDGRGPSIESAVEDGAGVVVAGVAGGDHPAAQDAAEVLDRANGRAHAGGHGAAPSLVVLLSVARCRYIRTARSASDGDGLAGSAALFAMPAMRVLI